MTRPEQPLPDGSSRHVTRHNAGTGSEVRLPDPIPVIPEIAQAALKQGLESASVTWHLLRAADTGRGRLAGDQARSLVMHGRAVGDRQARRLLHAGAALFWARDPENSVRLHGAARVAAALGVAHVTTPHLIPAEDFRAGRARLRAALQATIYAVDENGRPISRRRVEEATGVPPSTQRRYEGYGHADLIRPVHVQLSHIDNPRSQRDVAAAHRGVGFYLGRYGALMRRHADIRRATRHEPGSASVARRINRQLREYRDDRPATQARGQRAPRAFFAAPTDQPGTGGADFFRAKRAFGKGAPPRDLVHPIHDYAVIETRTAAGQRRYESAFVPFVEGTGQRLGGSLKRDLDLCDGDRFKRGREPPQEGTQGS